jgi:hypothetical protein
MIYVNIDNYEVKDSRGKLVCVEPQVHIEADVTANLDIAILREIKTQLEDILREGLNQAIIKEDSK